MIIVNATNARKRLYKLIDEVRETHEPLYITGKNGSIALYISYTLRNSR